MTAPSAKTERGASSASAASPKSRLRRSKDVERQVQQFLWPGSRFAGGAHRPALEDQDLTGQDAQGNLWWGEVKNWGWSKVAGAGGPWKVLTQARAQCEAAARRAHCQVKTFAVWWPPGSRLAEQRLVMYTLEGRGPVVVTLDQFREVIDNAPPGA